MQVLSAGVHEPSPHSDPVRVTRMAGGLSLGWRLPWHWLLEPRQPALALTCP